MGYNDDSIKVLSDREHILKNPLMYISGSIPSIQMFEEIFSNALDEAINGYADLISIQIDYERGRIRISDNGRGIPQGMNKDLDMPTIEVIYNKLNAGGKYDRESYDVSGGLHGVGSCVVNTLSRYLTVVTWRGKDVLSCTFKDGNPIYNENPVPVFKNEKSGTSVEYEINYDLELFDEDKLSMHVTDIESRLVLVSTLYPKIRIKYQGELLKSGGLSNLLPNDKYILRTPIIFDDKRFKLVCNWTDSLKYGTYLSYGNLIRTRSGGDHIYALEEALKCIFPQEILLGMNIVLSVTYPGIKFEGQSKDRAKSKDMRSDLFERFKYAFKSYLRDNPDRDEILRKSVDDKITLLNMRKAKKTVTRRDNRTSYLATLSANGFADCTVKDRSLAELTICEGLSAAGSLKQARNIETQAVLPLRGKFINAYHYNLKTVFENREAATIVSSINTGILEDFDITKSRYSKIIIFSDADPDGGHIACLLIAFFSKILPDLLKAGMIYLALPPLYGTEDKKGKFIPIHTEEDKNKYLSQGYHIQRYKGLGEMNPEQLRVSSLDPSTRRLVQLKYSENTESVVERIMSGDSVNRRDLLEEVGVYR